MDKPTFSDALNLSRRAYERFRLRDIRSDDAIRAFVAIIGLATRYARSDQPAYEAACKEAGIRLNKSSRKRPELGVLKLATNDPAFSETHWSNAAGYIAAPPNGDVPPQTFRAALTYMKARGGLRALSRLSAARRRGQLIVEPVDLTEFCDAQLTGIPGEAVADMDLKDGYHLVLVKTDGGKSVGWPQNDDAWMRRAAVATRKRANLVNLTRLLRQPRDPQESGADHVPQTVAVNVAEPPAPSRIDQQTPITAAAGDYPLRSHGDIDPRTSVVGAKLVKGGRNGTVGQTWPGQAATPGIVPAPFTVVQPADCVLRRRSGCQSRKLCRLKNQCLESQRRSTKVAAHLAAE